VDAPPYDPSTVNNLVDSVLAKDVVAVPEVSHDVTPFISDPPITPVTQDDVSPNPVKENPTVFSISTPLKSTK